MDDEFGVKKAWELSNILKRDHPIERNSVNGKSTTKTIKNPTKGKSPRLR